VFIPTHAKKGLIVFMIDFLMGEVYAAIFKIAATPIERVKILIQNLDEMLKSGHIYEPYKGITYFFGRIIKE